MVVLINGADADTRWPAWYTTTVDPSVSTVRDGDDVRITVSVTVDGHDPFAALARGAEAMLAAFHAAGVAVEGIVAGGLRSEVRPLQPV
jgi:hypothetical protein